MLADAPQELEPHVADTPNRVVRMYEDELLMGLGADPASVLSSSITKVTGFPNHQYDQMVIVKDVEFVSWCAHHLLPFIGHVHFAYLPGKKLVGLSKIGRLIDVLSKRPQLQELLTSQIVDVFQKVVQPKGCGACISALHTCMSVRGVKKAQATTITTALRGCFKKPDVKAEFLGYVGGGK